MVLGGREGIAGTDEIGGAVGAAAECDGGADLAGTWEPINGIGGGTLRGSGDAGVDDSGDSASEL